MKFTEPFLLEHAFLAYWVLKSKANDKEDLIFFTFFLHIIFLEILTSVKRNSSDMNHVCYYM